MEAIIFGGVKGMACVSNGPSICTVRLLAVFVSRTASNQPVNCQTRVELIMRDSGSLRCGNNTDNACCSSSPGPRRSTDYHNFRLVLFILFRRVYTICVRPWERRIIREFKRILLGRYIFWKLVEKNFLGIFVKWSIFLESYKSHQRFILYKLLNFPRRLFSQGLFLTCKRKRKK